MERNDAQRSCLDLVVKARRISQSVETYHILLLPIEKPQVAVIASNICGQFFAYIAPFVSHVRVT